MSGFSADEIIRLVKEENIRFVRLQFTDIFGQLKNVTITPAQLKKALNNEVTIDGSSIEGFVRIHESDQVLHPDLNSFAVLPDDGIGYRAARLICDVYNPDGTPFVGDPRGILKRELKRAEELGYTFNVGPECEFFLFRTDENAAPTTKTADEAGYFDLAPLDTASIPGMKSVWRWKIWVLKSRPAIMRALRGSMKLIFGMPMP